MKKVLLTLLGVIVVVGLLGGAGFAGYRIGFNQGARAAASRQAAAQLPSQNKNANPNGGQLPQPFNKGFGFQNMPGRFFGNGMMNRGFNRGFGPGGFGMMSRGRGFGFFGPFQFLFRIAVFAFVIWVIYMLFKGSGWTLTRQPAQQAVKAEPQASEPKTE
jgi:hypothetical protein